MPAGHLNAQAVLARGKRLLPERHAHRLDPRGIGIDLIPGGPAIDQAAHLAAVTVAEEVGKHFARERLLERESHLQPLPGLRGPQQDDTQVVEAHQMLRPRRLAGDTGLQSADRLPPGRQCRSRGSRDADRAHLCLPATAARLPKRLHLNVLAVGAESKVIHHEGIAANALRQASSPVAVGGVGHFAHGGGRLAHHAVIAERRVHGDLGLHQSVGTGEHLVAVSLQESRAVQAQLQEGEGMVGVARGAVVAVEEDEIAARIRGAPEAGEVERFLRLEAVASVQPAGERQPVDAPFAGEVRRRDRLQALVRPERLPQAEDTRVQAGPVTIVEPAPVLSEIRRLVQVVDGGVVERPVGHHPRDQHLLAAQQLLERTAFQWAPVTIEEHEGEDRRRGRAVPVEVVCFADHPGVRVQGRESPSCALDALLPDAVWIVFLKIAAEAVERDRRPLPVPRANRRRRPRQAIDALILTVVQLPGEGVRDAQALFIGEDRALLDQVPVEHHQVGIIVVRAGKGIVLILDPFLIDPGDLFQRLLIGEGEADRLPGMEGIAGHVVHRHPLADAVPPEVADRAVVSRCLPRLERRQILGHGDPLAEADLHQPAESEAALLAVRLADLGDEGIRSGGDAGGITAAREDHVVPAAERVMERAHLIPARPGIAEVGQREVAVIQLLDRPIGGAVAQNDEVPPDRHRCFRRIVADNRDARSGHLLDRLLDPGRITLMRRRRHDGCHRPALSHQIRREIEWLQLRVLRRHRIRRRRE